MSHHKATRSNRAIAWGRDLLTVLGPLVRCIMPLALANIAFTLLSSVNVWLALFAYFAGIACFPVALVREFRRLRDGLDQRVVGALVSVLHTANHAEPVPVADVDPLPEPVSTGDEESRLILDELAALADSSAKRAA